MNTVTLQVPMNSQIKKAASKVATEYGFSSLQELTRLLLTKVANRHLVVNIEDTAIQLSQKNSRRYDKMVEEIESGKVKPFTANSIDELMTHLHGN